VTTTTAKIGPQFSQTNDTTTRKIDEIGKVGYLADHAGTDKPEAKRLPMRAGRCQS
jgi:hypothetical protein